MSLKDLTKDNHTNAERQEFVKILFSGNIDPKHPIIVERLIFQLAYDYMLIGHNVSTYDLLNLYKKNCLLHHFNKTDFNYL